MDKVHTVKVRTVACSITIYCWNDGTLSWISPEKEDKKGPLFERSEISFKKEVQERNRHSSIHAGRVAEIEPTRLGF